MQPVSVLPSSPSLPRDPQKVLAEVAAELTAAWGPRAAVHLCEMLLLETLWEDGAGGCPWSGG